MAYLIERILGTQAGNTVKVTPDYIIVNDGLSHQAIEGLEKVAYPERVVVYYDHDVPAGTSRTSEIFAELLAFTRRFGVHFVQSEGIGALHLLNGEIQPNMVVVGGGEHASIFGAKGALGVNLSVEQLRSVIETGSFEMVVPETVRVRLTGAMKNGVSMMDVALHSLKTCSGAGKAVEFICGDLPEKETLCAVAGMRGAFAFAVEDSAEADAVLDMAEVEPMVMLPCGERAEQSKAEIAELASVRGMHVDAGQIGGYTGGTIEQLRRAAALIKGGTLKRRFRLSVCPATSKDYLMAIEEGLIETFIRFGAQIHAVGDRSVVSQGPGTVDEQETLLTTGLYTFDGCMGVKGSKVLCAGVEAVMAAAVTGEI